MFTKIRQEPLAFLGMLLVLYLLFTYLESMALQNAFLGKCFNQFTYWAALHTSWVFQLLGFESEVNQLAAGSQLYVNKAASVYIGYPCNGLSIWILFCVFIIAAGGKRINYLWFLPLGWLSIHLINVFRVFMLAIIYKYQPTWVDFNHKYVFTLLVYSWVFLLFVYWIKKHSAITAKPTKLV